MKSSLIARAEKYQSFARLFLYEPDAETLEKRRHDPHFATAAVDLRALRVEFTRLFALNVFPYASIFLDPEALLNTETTARVEADYEKEGFAPARELPVGAPDHFGVELSFVAHLLSSDREEAANQFLSAELLAWSQIFLCAVEKNAREDFYRVLANETRQWLLDDFESGWDAGKALNGNTAADLAAPDIEQNDLYSIVSFLISPGRSGIFLSKEDLSTIGRRLELPVGFGDRGLMLKSLFRSAGEFEKIAELLAALNEEIDYWINQYASASEQHASAPRFLRPWFLRAVATAGLLQEMVRASETARR